MTEEDINWLLSSLKSPDLKWFVVKVVSNANLLPDIFLESLLRAGIEEISPESNKYFIQPCMRIFGPRKVNSFFMF